MPSEPSTKRTYKRPSDQMPKQEIPQIPLAGRNSSQTLSNLFPGESQTVAASHSVRQHQITEESIDYGQSSDTGQPSLASSDTRADMRIPVSTEGTYLLSLSLFQLSIGPSIRRDLLSLLGTLCQFLHTAGTYFAAYSQSRLHQPLTIPLDYSFYFKRCTARSDSPAKLHYSRRFYDKGQGNPSVPFSSLPSTSIYIQEMPDGGGLQCRYISQS
jgi:hypothetical protein